LPLWIFGPLVFGALALLSAEEGRKFIVNRRNRRVHTHTETTQVTSAS
jgi:sodium/potassium-transporting ATPase subunit alpha